MTRNRVVTKGPKDSNFSKMEIIQEPSIKVFPVQVGGVKAETISFPRDVTVNILKKFLLQVGNLKTKKRGKEFKFCSP